MSKIINEALLALHIKELQEELSRLKKTQGKIGEKGDPGESGPIGLRGKKGDPGDKGIKGDKGERGPIGESITGKQGFQGDRGLRGFVGPQGEIGPIGEEGIPGIPGPQGLIGEQGPIGLQGVQGEEGPKGLKGERGFIGEQGPKGDQGFPGMEGPPGEIGERGLVGKTGEKGPKGDQGERGPIGLTGPSGKDLTSEEVKPLLTNLDGKYQQSYDRFVSNVNKSLASLGGGGLGEKDVIAIAKEYGGGGGSGTTDSAYLSALQQSLVPAVDSAYDLGAPNLKWKDLYLSGQSFFLGNSVIREDAANNKIRIKGPDGSEIKNTNNNTTTIPTGDLRLTQGDSDVVAREDDGGKTLGIVDFDAFGSDLRTMYDCLEPHGQFKILDYGSNEAYVGAQ